MKILVTGCAGFIGSNFVQKLLENNEHEVVGVDSMVNGRWSNVPSGFRMMWADLRSIDVCMQACVGVDWVVHFAAIGSVQRSIEDPVFVNDNNVNATLNMLTAARDMGAKRFVNVSSSSVYGDSKELPKVETMEPNPKTPYAASKLSCEHYARLFHEIYGLSTVSLRYFNVFGPRQNPLSAYAAVVPRFAMKALSGEPAKIYGDGEQTRDFTFVRDVVEATLSACKESSVVGRSLNVGGGDTITINDLWKKTCEIVGKDIEPRHVERRKGDIRNSLADASLAKDLLEFKPYAEASFDECLAETIEWFRR